MKSFLSFTLLIASFSASAYQLACTSQEEYSDGSSIQSEFNLPLYRDMSTRTSKHNDYEITISHESEDTEEPGIGKFHLNLANESGILLDKEIELNNPITFESPKFNYTLECRIDVK